MRTFSCSITIIAQFSPLIRMSATLEEEQFKTKTFATSQHNCTDTCRDVAVYLTSSSDIAPKVLTGLLLFLLSAFVYLPHFIAVSLRFDGDIYAAWKMDPCDLEFIGENEMIGIIPNFSIAEIHLVSGTFGPFRAGMPVHGKYSRQHAEHNHFQC